MKCVFSLNMIKKYVCFICINTFVCFVNDKKIPVCIFYFFVFVISTTKIDGSFQILKRFKFNVRCTNKQSRITSNNI